MKKRKILYLLLALSFLLGISGCNTQPAAPGSNSQQTPQDTQQTQNTESEQKGTEFPLEKPITIICYYDAGGGADVAARILSATAPSIIDQRVDIINMAGAGGQEALEYLIKQPQDGYTLLLGSQTFIDMALTQKVNFDLQDFTPIIKLSKSCPVIFGKADGKIQSIDDLVEACKADPESVSVAHGRVNSAVHVTLKSLENAAGIRTANVPTTGGAEALSFVLGGHTDLGVSVPSTLSSTIASGETVALAVADEQRWPDLPDVPTLKELGYDVSLPSGYLIYAYGDVPQERIDFLAEKFREAMETESAIGMAKGAAVTTATELDLDACMADYQAIIETMTAYYKSTGEYYENN